MRRKKAIVDRSILRRPVPGAIAALAFLAVAGLVRPPESAAQSDGPVPIVFDARIVGDANRTRFVADMTDAADAAVFTLADPYRIVVDMSEVGFRLPDDAGQKGRGLFSAFRYGLISRGKSRIVLDVDGPVKVDKSFVVPPADNQPARLVIDVVPTSRKAFLAANRAYRDSLAVKGAAKRDRALVATGQGGPGPTVVIDPGHGGIDTGAKGRNGSVEKNLTLAFAKILGKKLKETGRYNVLFTRTDDSFVALGDRVAFARENNADLFVSVHANSFRGRSVRGAIIYTVSDDASDKMAAEIAQSENQADVLSGIDIPDEDSDEVMDILLDLTQRETRNFGTVFAKNLVKELKLTTPMFKVPHQQAGFKVLEAPDVPSAMIELGFVSNADDEKLLLSDSWRDKTAGSVVQAIDDFFERKLAQRGGQ
ncbi:N-acetylmuramoyl-L-alanine amidase [Bauldia sp.]|uniref:N-acetylmuramoyl-L-alanine amidase n=1 Tax=Bauldia sp. TaxID=2575872 RepID=UPI0025B8B299|nr:N-acetylmuramoyl-L-alanine amidase [Bauldia sp.]